MAGPRPPAPPPAPAPAHRRKGPGTAIAAAAISLVVLIALVTLGWSWFFSGEDASTTVAPSPTAAPASLTLPPSPTREPTPTPDPTSSPPVETLAPPAAPTKDTATASTSKPTPDLEADDTADVQDVALAELELRRADSLAFVALDGRWVAVLSTKKSGTEDPDQTAKNGSHVFYEEDILALHDDLALYFWDEARVLMVKTSDFGKQPKGGDVFWRSIADAGFTSKEDVTAWCGQHYSGTPKEIENSCLAREMLPPTRS